MSAMNRERGIIFPWYSQKITGPFPVLGTRLDKKRGKNPGKRSARIRKSGIPDCLTVMHTAEKILFSCSIGNFFKEARFAHGFFCISGRRILKMVDALSVYPQTKFYLYFAIFGKKFAEYDDSRFNERLWILSKNLIERFLF